jgi:uncharacterized repeat protein (TIGR02543 family)
MAYFRKNVLKMSRIAVYLSALLLWSCAEIPDYAIFKAETSSSEGGTVSISPPGPEYKVGTQVTLTATPKSNYRFDYWSGEVSGTSNPVRFNISGDKYNEKTATAKFVRVYRLTVNNNLTDGGTTTHDGSTTHDSGTVVAVTATPKPGYRFDKWSGASTSENATVTIMMNGDKTLTANYKRIFTLDVVPPCCGTVRVTVNGNTVSTPKDLDSGTVVSVTVTPSSDHRFTGWSGAPSSVNLTSPSITFPMKDKYSLIANFGRMYNLTVVVSPSGGGTVRVTVNGSPITISPNEGAVPIDSGTVVSATATKNDGYRFDRWSGASTSTNSTVTVTMNDHKTLTAHYVRIFTLTVNNNPMVGGSTAHDGTTTHDSGATVIVTATPNTNPGYRFNGWTPESDVLSPSEKSTGVIMNGNKTLTANYVRIYNLTVTVEPFGGGTVTVTVNGNPVPILPNGGTVSIDSGAAVVVLGNPKIGYDFDEWSGELRFTMNDNKNLTATFKIKPNGEP